MSDELMSVLQLLADEDRPVHSVDLSPLSDVSRAQLAAFRLAWEGFSVTRRREMLDAMVAQAETNIRMNFHVILRACLTDADARVRRLAIEGLWEDEKANLVEPLAVILSNDEDASVRSAAAISLGRFVLLGEFEEIPLAAARAAEQALRAAWFRVGEVTEVRRRALEGLAYTATAGLHELIQNAYYDEDALMRQSAVFSMGRSNDTRWSRIVLEEMGSQEPAMRYEAAQAAGEMSLKSAVPALIRHLDDSDGTVRQAAAAALGKIGGPAAKRALEALVGGSDEALSQAAEDALDEWNFNSDNLDNLLLDIEERSKQDRAELEGTELWDDELDDDEEALTSNGFDDELVTIGDYDLYDEDDADGPFDDDATYLVWDEDDEDDEDDDFDDDDGDLR